MASKVDAYRFLDALKVGESHAYENALPSTIAPSSRPAYCRAMYACSEMNRERGRTDFVVRKTNDKAFHVLRINDGVTCVEPPAKAGTPGTQWSPRAPKAKTAPAPDIARMVADEVARALGKPAAPTGKDFWLVQGSPHFAFESKSNAEGFHKTLGSRLPLLHLRQVND